MRISSYASAGALLLGIASVVAAPGAAQAQVDEHEQKRVYGYQDPFTGTFHPIEQAVPDVTTAPFTGTFLFTFDVSLKTTLEKPPTVSCAVAVSALSLTEASTGATEVSYNESGGSIGTVTGTNATCLVTIHYSWVIPQSGGSVIDTISASYSVTESALSSSTTTTPGPGQVTRSSSSGLLTLKAVPPSGTTTSKTVNVTL